MIYCSRNIYRERIAHMNLINFDDHLDNKIVDRGRGYFLNRNVTCLDEEAENIFIAVVSGTDDYSVSVQLDESNNILISECDCPYDIGPYCKHEVAVFFAIRELRCNKLINNSDGISDAKPDHKVLKEKVKSQRQQAEEKFTGLLSKLSKDELINIIVSLSIEYEEIGRKIEFTLDRNSNEQEVENSRALIRSYIDKHSDRDGYLLYRQVHDACRGAEMVLERAEEAFDDEEYILALELYLCIIHEMLSALSFADDSDGNIGGEIAESLIGIATLTEEELTEDIRKTIFNILLKESTLKDYNGWDDWRLELLGACTELANEENLRKILEQQFDLITQGMARTDNSWSAKYLNEGISNMRFRLVELNDSGEKAAKYIENNLKYSHFREMAINGALKDEDYKRAEELCIGGEENDKVSPGLVDQWKRYRYQIYELTGQIDEQRKVAFDFILDGDFDYYKKLKATYLSDEWKKHYPDIIRILEAKKDYAYSRVYSNILIEENEHDKLLSYVKESPSRIEKFYKHLIPCFKDEVFSLFTLHILNESKRAFQRSHYRDVCSKIRILNKAGGNEVAKDIVNTLLMTYQKKPAFKDELSKLRLK